MKVRKILPLALSALFAVSAFSSCFGFLNNSSGSGNDSSSSGQSSEKPSATYTTLPDEDWSPETLKSNGESLSSYKIVVPADKSASVQYAAEVFQKYVKLGTNVEIPIVTDATSEGTHEIMIGDTARTEDEGIDFSALGAESFTIKTVGNDLLIAGNQRGVLYGVYEYLEALGYRFYAADAQYTPKAQNIFIAQGFERSWEPMFYWRETMYMTTNDYSVGSKEAKAEWCVANKVNSNYVRQALKTETKYGGSVGWIGGDQYMVHTARKFLPYTPVMATEHPDWFAREDGRILVSGTDGYDTDPCWSNEEALDYIYDKMLETIDNDGVSNMVSLSMNDTTSYCKCETCSEQQAEYGVSGWFYRAVNKIAVRLKEDRPNVKLDTIAYSYAIDPPDIVLEDNVVVRLCLGACRWHTNPEECKELGGGLQESRDTFLAWKEHASEFTIYAYPINWANNLTADPSYQAIYNQYKWYAENGVTSIYCEGYPVQNGEFCELKAYLTAKLLANPLMSYGEYQYHMRDFLQGYYGEGWESILDYIDTIYDIVMQDMADNNYHIAPWYSYEENFPFRKYWDGEKHVYDNIIADIDEYWEDALAVANETQAKRIRKSRIHWRYVKLYNTFDNIKQYGTAEEKDVLYAENEELYNDMIEFYVLQRNADGPILDVMTNFTRNPKTWWNK